VYAVVHKCLDDLQTKFAAVAVFFRCSPSRPDMVANATTSQACSTLYLPWLDSRFLSSTSTSPPYWMN
jgi:hypothetical protein